MSATTGQSQHVLQQQLATVRVAAAAASTVGPHLLKQLARRLCEVFLQRPQSVGLGRHTGLQLTNTRLQRLGTQQQRTIIAAAETMQEY